VRDWITNNWPWLLFAMAALFGIIVGVYGIYDRSRQERLAVVDGHPQLQSFGGADSIYLVQDPSDDASMFDGSEEDTVMVWRKESTDYDGLWGGSQRVLLPSGRSTLSVDSISITETPGTTVHAFGFISADTTLSYELFGVYRRKDGEWRYVGGIIARPGIDYTISHWTSEKPLFSRLWRRDERKCPAVEAFTPTREGVGGR